MTTVIDTDVGNTNDARKTAIINNELLHLKCDIAIFQKTRLAGQGSIKEKNFTFFGMVSLLTNVANMELALLSRIRFYSMWKLDLLATNVTLRLHTKKGAATLVSVYAHTLNADEKIKDVFYSKLNLSKHG